MMDVILFIYGLAFMTLGATIVLRNDNSSSLHLSRQLWLLAAFGFTHGFVEWMSLWCLFHEATPLILLAQPLVLLASYLFLFEFGRRLVISSLSESIASQWITKVLCIWIYALMFFGILLGVFCADQHILALNIWSRYLPGFFGANLAGVGFYIYSHNQIVDDEVTPNGSEQAVFWHMAAWAFIAYGVLGGLIVSSADWIPASIINESTFIATFGVPVQLIRAICAVLITISVAKLLRIFSNEDRRKLQHAKNVGQLAIFEFEQIKSRYAAILNSVSDGIIGIDIDGNINLANNLALVVLGYQKKELNGKSFRDLIQPTTRDGKSRKIDELLILNTPYKVDREMFLHKNGHGISVAYKVTALKNGGQTNGFVIVFKELSEF